MKLIYTLVLIFTFISSANYAYALRGQCPLGSYEVAEDQEVCECDDDSSQKKGVCRPNPKNPTCANIDGTCTVSVQNLHMGQCAWFLDDGTWLSADKECVCCKPYKLSSPEERLNEPTD